MRPALRQWLLLAASLVAAILVIAALWFAASRRDLRGVAEAAAQARADQIIAAADRHLAADIGALRLLGTSPALAAQDWQRLRAEAAAARSATPGWQNLVLRDAGGGVLFDLAGAASARVSRPSGAPAVAAVVAGAPSIGGISNNGAYCPCLALVQPINVGGRAYTLRLDIAPQGFEPLVMNGNPGAIEAIVDRAGRFIARDRNYAMRLGKPATQYVRAAIRAGDRGVYRGITLEGLENYSAFATSPLSGWSAHSALPSAAFDRLTRVSDVATLIAVAIALLLAGLIVALVLRNIAAERRMRARAAQSQRLEALGLMTGGVAHDFNNLLTVITTSAATLRRPDLPPERRDRLLDAINATAERAARLTAQLLAYAARKPLKPQRFAANKRIAGILEMLQTLAGSRIGLQLAGLEAPCEIEVDPSQFETALVNLVVNARDAIASGGSADGRITVSLRGSTVVGSGESTREAVTISVADTGPGMTPDVLARIFEPFYTTKSDGRGTGLGLSQVYGFVRQSGGAVRVDTTPGNGSVFHLDLPLAPGPPIGA